MIKAKKKASEKYSRLLVFIMLIATASIPAPYLYEIILNDFPLPGLSALIFSLLFICVGYGMQSLLGTVFKIKRMDDTGAYEKTESFFKFHQAALPLCMAVVIGFLIFKGYYSYLQYRYTVVLGAYFDKLILTPAYVAVLSALIAAAGVIIWFYPPGRVISVKTVIPFTVSFFVLFLLKSFYLGGLKNELFLTFCLTLYLVCAFFVLNQSGVSRTFLLTRVVKVTPSAVTYNFAVVLLFIILFGAAAAVVLSVLVGFGAIGKMVSFAFLRKLFAQSERYDDAVSAAQSFGGYVFNRLIGSFDVKGILSRIFFVIFIIIITAVVFFFILNRRRGAWSAIKRFLLLIYNQITQLIAFLFGLREKKPEEEYVIPDYRDSEQKLDASSVKPYEIPAAEKKRGYRDFLNVLNSIPDETGRYKYAYITLIDCWKRLYGGISPSDTPRRIMEKILAKSSEKDTEEITSVFERIKYAEENPPPSDYEKAFGSACRIIRSLLG